MTRFIFCILVLAACGDNQSPPAPDDAEQTDGFPSPEADGEYIVKVSPISFTCYGKTRPTHEFYSLADIVSQENPGTFDLRTTLDLQGTFSNYGRNNISWNNADGFFSESRIKDVSFAGFTLQAELFIEGSAKDDGSLVLFHRYELLSLNESNGKYDSICVYEANVVGKRRYAPWDGTPRASIDGQWRVKKTILASPTIRPENLPYTGFVIIDTLAQTDDGSVFDISGGIYHEPLRYVNRDSSTGAVDATELLITPGVDENNQPQTTLYETKLWDTLLPDTMNLYFSWTWSIIETNTEHWFQHEHYEGVPRYQPHNQSLAEPPEGAYNAEYTLTSSDCSMTPYAEHRVLDVWPTDDDGVWPRVTTLGIEPVLHLGPGGTLAMAFGRHTSNHIYSYSVNGTVEGHTLNLTMIITALNNIGVYECTVFYQIVGQKRYESYR